MYTFHELSTNGYPLKKKTCHFQDRTHLQTVAQLPVIWARPTKTRDIVFDICTPLRLYAGLLCTGSG